MADETLEPGLGGSNISVSFQRQCQHSHHTLSSRVTCEELVLGRCVLTDYLNTDGLYEINLHYNRNTETTPAKIDPKIKLILSLLLLLPPAVTTIGVICVRDVVLAVGTRLLMVYVLDVDGVLR